jgi:hypothetical protein
MKGLVKAYSYNKVKKPNKSILERQKQAINIYKAMIKHYDLLTLRYEQKKKDEMERIN